MKLVVVHAIIHCFGSKKLAPCKNFSWLLNWHLKMAPGDFSGSYFLGAKAAPPPPPPPPCLREIIDCKILMYVIVYHSPDLCSPTCIYFSYKV